MFGGNEASRLSSCRLHLAIVHQLLRKSLDNGRRKICANSRVRIFGNRQPQLQWRFLQTTRDAASDRLQSRGVTLQIRNVADEVVLRSLLPIRTKSSIYPPYLLFEIQQGFRSQKGSPLQGILRLT